MVNIDKKTYYTISDLAQLMGISRIAVFKKVKSGVIRAYKIGRNYAVPKSEFESLSGESLTTSQKLTIDQAVSGTISEYGEVLKMLGRE